MNKTSRGGEVCAALAGGSHEAVQNKQIGEAPGAVIKTKDVLAKSDSKAVLIAQSEDCPVCDVLKDGERVGSVI